METTIKTSRLDQAATLQLILRFHLSTQVEKRNHNKNKQAGSSSNTAAYMVLTLYSWKKQRKTTTETNKVAQAVILQLTLQFYLDIHLEKQKKTTAKRSELDETVTPVICA
jgi:hypothetical protein